MGVSGGPGPIGLWAALRALGPMRRGRVERRAALDEEELRDLEAAQTGVRQGPAPRGDRSVDRSGVARPGRRPRDRPARPSG